jgi:hypothetical protein
LAPNCRGLPPGGGLYLSILEDISGDVGVEREKLQKRMCCIPNKIERSIVLNLHPWEANIP